MYSALVKIKEIEEDGFVFTWFSRQFGDESVFEFCKNKSTFDTEALEEISEASVGDTICLCYDDSDHSAFVQENGADSEVYRGFLTEVQIMKISKVAKFE